MEVYHNSYMEFFEIDLSKSHSNKDFGTGFYVTKFRIRPYRRSYCR